MKKYILFIFLLILFSCSNKSKIKKQKAVLFQQQWFNPLFLNSDFEKELNFPYWFNDSILKKNKIFQITRRIFSDKEKDSNGHYMLPKEKFIYTFDKFGSIKKIDYYSFYDSKEITALTFLYSKKTNKNILKQLQVLPLKAEYKKYKDLFKIQLISDATLHFTFYKKIEKTKKYFAYQDLENKNKLYVLKNKKYHGALSVDSILHPNVDDWIILGSVKKPLKRFQSQNIVNQKNIYEYNYNKNGVLVSRNLKKYPFYSKKYFLYNNKKQWVMSIDSLFYEKLYISSEFTVIEYDKYNRPRKINYNKSGENKNYNKSVETFSYRLIK